MQLSSTTDCLSNAVDTYVSSFDVDLLSGADAAGCLSLLTPVLRKLSMLSLRLGARAVDCNQHNVVGARSGAAWFGSVVGVSERSAASRLGAVKALSLNPDVGSAVESGSLSFEKATLIAGLAKGSVCVTEQLMANASSDSYESLKRRGQNLNVGNESGPDRSERLRLLQYVQVEPDSEGMLAGCFRLLPGPAAGFFSLWKAAESAVLRAPSDLPRSVVAAEAFSTFLSNRGGSSKGVVNYHVRLEDFPVSPDVCEVASVGLVPISVLQALGEHPALRLLISARNKLVWYSEATYRPDGPLPEFIKRAVKANQRDQCAGAGCVGNVDEIDHSLARTNGGDNAFSNLQGLCWSDHVAKTKRDAPWTVGESTDDQNRRAAAG